jgi:FtsP/CotA-like multicopper oxidase with cupredoxin domain
MAGFEHWKIDRRSLLIGGTSAAVTAVALARAAPGSAKTFSLTAAPARVPLVGHPHPETDVWSYQGLVPGPEIRARRGDRIQVTVENRLPEETTVHWHGVRVPNAMDGVPHLTQRPIAPGETFTYAFDAPDAGTYWYHPHQHSSAQVGRGLYGPLIIEETHPIKVDRDLVWVLGDWRLLENAQISDDFDNRHDMAHNGRVGNTVTLNGKVPDTFAVRSSERLRLRLINAANARIFGLEFAEHRPLIVAYDGQAVAPHEPDGGRVVIGPAMRMDLVIDMTGKPGTRFMVTDRFYRGLEYRFVDLIYDPVPLRERPLDTPIAVAPNALPEPDMNSVERHVVTFNGGMMGGMMMSNRGGMGGMNMMEMMHSGKIWFINGIAETGHVLDPMLRLQCGHSYVLALNNETAWHHPIHLHGHCFRVISRNGTPTRYREWRDTVLMSPREKVEIAFVADNPGDWMFHCHVLEHQAGGMMGVIRVGVPDDGGGTGLFCRGGRDGIRL